MNKKQKVIILRGLPGSGKSTWANNFIKENLDYKIVSRDIIRNKLMSKNKKYKFNEKNENKVTEIFYKELKNYLKSGFSVICDNTNLKQQYVNSISNFVKNINENIEIEINNSFIKVPVPECIERDRNREEEKRVGSHIILNMWKNYLIENKTYELPKNSNTRRKAVMCDLDGTLAIFKRSPYDLEKVENDIPNLPLFEILNMYIENGYTILFTSGREGKKEIEQKTYNWICDNFEKFRYNFYNNDYFRLFMRNEGDYRADSIIKKEIYKAWIELDYDVKIVFDDRDAVVNMWRSLGLQCFQVNYGNF